MGTAPRLDIGPDAASRVPWTVVHLSADGSPAVRSLSVLLAWLAARPDVALHTVLWLPGWSDTAAFELGRFHDVALDHRARLPRALRRVGQPGRAGALVARAARRTLADVPTSGVLYLSGASSAVALRYLPPGDRTLVTHLLASDRDADPPLPAARADELRSATEVWLAEDDATRDWAATTLGIDPASIEVVGNLVDLAGWDRTQRRDAPDRLSLAVLGAPWFDRDHTARLVHALGHLRPGLDLDLTWAEVEREAHLAPMRHDLRVLGVLDDLTLPADHREVAERLARADVLALTAPDEDTPHLAWEAARAGLPVVCFDSHRHAAEVGSAVRGQVVPYLDLPAMAAAVIGQWEAVRNGDLAAIGEQRAALLRCDVDVVGRHLLERVAPS